MSTSGRTMSLLVLAALIGGCTPSERRERADTGVARAVTESPGTLATRREAQDALDRARLALERKDSLLAKSELNGAATFLRTEAQSAVGEGQTALRRAADDLDALGDRIAKGGVSAAALVTASLAVNKAEAAYHLQRAKDAVAQAAHTRVAEELTMTIDHLERAAKDAGRQGDAAISSAISDARTLANEVSKGASAVPDEITKVTTRLSDAITRVGDLKVTKES